MKKVIIILFIISIGLLFNNKKENIVIPKEAIRYRIIASSNNFIDQEQKILINASVEPLITSIMQNSSNIEEARQTIKESIPSIRKEINNYNVAYDLNYGYNYFPEKSYKGINYPAGEYESLVVTLGDGLGDNWWCVLFPPLCLLEATESDLDEAEYTFYFKDIINKFS